jgi:hypothetical protein
MRARTFSTLENLERHWKDLSPAAVRAKLESPAELE